MVNKPLNPSLHGLNISKALAYAIHSLCIHDKYIEVLRSEVAAANASGVEDPLRHMQLLNAFLRESARLNPLDARMYCFASANYITTLAHTTQCLFKKRSCNHSSSLTVA
jgi:hypothetical protein